MGENDDVGQAGAPQAPAPDLPLGQILGRHGRQRSAPGVACKERGEKVQASVARCLRTPPYGATRKDLGSGYPDCLRSQSHRRSIVVIGNYAIWTGNGGTSPRQSKHLYTFVDPVSAPSIPQ